MKDLVCQAANSLTELGVQTGDRVAIYLPMIPEAVVAMLACARIGAPAHRRVRRLLGRLPRRAPGGLPGQGRDHLRRRLPPGRAAALKPAVDEARAKAAESGTRSTRSWWSSAPARTSPGTTTSTCGGTRRWRRRPPSTSCEFFDAEHPLYVMYTSGTTGKPKGILHTTGGYLTGTAYTHWAVFDIKPETDVYWCTADIGWVTGHSYIVYGPMANGVTQVMYEGTPDSPERGRWWQIIADHKVTIFYTAPTAIRSFMKQGREIPDKHDMSSLRILGSVGEPINPEAYIWYRQVIGGDRTPVVDTWWQTETGMIMISPLPGVTHGKPGSAMIPIPGVEADVVTEEGDSVPDGSGGYLVLTEPWPAMLRTIWGDDERFQDTYWSRYADQGWYFAGDGAKKDSDGDLWVLGRVDDVMNVSGHRLSTTEIESALVSHPKVAEAAVVGAKDEDTGQGICAFVILREEAGDGGADIVEDLRNHVRQQIGAIAKPRQIMIVAELPKTRSGKIMRRLLRDVAEHREIGDVTTLADSSVMDLISAGIDSGKGED